MGIVGKTVIFHCKLVTGSALVSVAATIATATVASSASTEAASGNPEALAKAAAADTSFYLACAKAVFDVGKMIDCITENYQSEASTNRLQDLRQAIDERVSKLKSSPPPSAPSAT